MIRRKRNIPNLHLSMDTDRVEEFEIDGQRFSVKFMVEEYPELDYLGTYTDKPDWSGQYLIIDRQQHSKVVENPEPIVIGKPWYPFITVYYGRNDAGRNGYRYFQCAIDLEEDRAWLHKNGYSKHDAWLLPRQWSMEAYHRMEDYNNSGWCMLGIEVTHLETGHTDDIWGVESDAREYINELVYDMARGLTPQSLEDLLGISDVMEVA